jgi:long-chain acyl-CoA synthetase
VNECTVIGVPDERWGERVHAVVVLLPGQTLDLESLRTYCRKFIAGYKCPKSLEVRPEPLPRSATGKVLKRELRIPYWEGRARQI